MKDFISFNFGCEGFPPRQVFKKGTGPAVVLMHELPGMIPGCVDLARRIAAAGFTVYLPLFFGEPDTPFSVLRTLGFVGQLCLSQEFYCFAKRQSSPITQWLRALCRKAHEDSGGPGVGVIGMCLTGGFVLSLMADESVIAPVASQPSLPIGITLDHKQALGLSNTELDQAKARADSGVPLLALRFSEDGTSPIERMEGLRAAFGDTPEIIRDDHELCWKRGKALETIEINSAQGNPFNVPKSSHAILTLGYRETGHPAHQAFERV
ncbi:MAG: dienelactone hydrolase family protein, partial [Cyanobacteria bacterium J06639_16]